MFVLLFVCLCLWLYIVIIPYQEINRLSVLRLSGPFWVVLRVGNKLTQWVCNSGLGRLRWESVGVEGCHGLMSGNLQTVSRGAAVLLCRSRNTRVLLKMLWGLASSMRLDLVCSL